MKDVIVHDTGRNEANITNNEHSSDDNHSKHESRSQS